MYVNHSSKISSAVINIPGIAGASRQTLIGPEQGWEGWVMRLFTLKQDGHTPRHSHPWPHINYIVSGEGIQYIDGVEHPVQAGSVAYVPGDVEHQFLNRGEQDFSFICIVPEEGDK